MISTRTFTAFLFVLGLAFTVQAFPIEIMANTIEECIHNCDAQNEWCSSARKRDGSPMFTTCPQIRGECRSSCDIQFDKT
ncbi:hypothetical protein EC957_011249 [Mortierella hygrophila]|uniref:ShKT domain-containing protein n=1 Tax=Mortierella hygrophila TaxID=979708 RepID=A0A9P6F8T8_9FUNG|nr:hypothetical protein EC957_011249 [Mortierella hygrophila]